MNGAVRLALRGVRLAIAGLSLVAGGPQVKIPLDKIIHATDNVVNRIQGNVEVALNKVASLTMDHWGDGTRFRRPLGVNSANLLTSSGIAPYSIQASNVASGALLGSSIATGTISVDNLATANQFSVYRAAAFGCGAGAYSIFLADTVVKDVATGYNTANGVYTIPTSGDWQFQWNVGATLTNAPKQLTTGLVINSGTHVFGASMYSPGAGNYLSPGSYLYCNALAGDKVKVDVFNGDTVTAAMVVGSGANFFQGYRLR